MIKYYNFIIAIAVNKVRNYFVKKYGVNKNNVDVIYRPVRFNDKGEVIEITGASIENIMDITYQRELMKEWIKRENKAVDFDRIIKLDEKVNAELNLENDQTKHKTWAIKWLMINNFLSFGDENYLPFNKLRGLTVVNSVPANQGGKTTLTIDALKFLLHGNTTKTDKNEQIFNQYSNKNELVVRGMIEIDGEETIIERKMKRTAKKGTNEWNVTNKVNYYKLLPDGEEEQLNEDDATKTTAKIRTSIGSEKDFEMLVLATEKNLDDLIGLTTTESGKVLTRLIGLEVIEMKETAVRKMYNEFDKKKKSNEYNIITLGTDIVDHTEKIELGVESERDLNEKLESTKDEIVNLNNENDKLLNSKITIDTTILSMNPSKLESEITAIKISGVAKKENIDNLIVEIDKLKDVIFDEDEHNRLTKLSNKNISDIQTKTGDILRTEQTINDLISGGICKTCNRKLDTVDNTEHIEKHKQLLEQYRKDLIFLKGLDATLSTALAEIGVYKKQVDKRNKLELDKDRFEVEVGALRNSIVSKMNDLKQYKLNQNAIESNRNIDAEVSIVKTKLVVAHRTKDELTSKIERVKLDVATHQTSIVTKTKLIEQIKKEDEVDKIYKIYIELVGKKGISKLVLRSVLPIINSEAQRLLEDVCDFEIEIFIDDKNDVQFFLVKDDVAKLLKSGSGFEKTAASLALRGVLGKLSTLPMPNFITFDEILGKIANENLEKLKPLFDKIKNMYEIVFLITHNDIIKDWADNVITVEKITNISKITIK